MSRILLLIIGLLGAFVWLRHFLIKGKSQNTSVQDNDLNQPHNKQSPENMVACAHCGVRLPLSESLRSATDEKYFCCEDHLRLQHNK